MLSSLENLIYLTDAVLHRDFQLTKRPRTLRNETWFALLPFQEKKLKKTGTLSSALNIAYRL